MVKTRISLETHFRRSRRSALQFSDGGSLGSPREHNLTSYVVGQGPTSSGKTNKTFFDYRTSIDKRTRTCNQVATSHCQPARVGLQYILGSIVIIKCPKFLFTPQPASQSARNGKMSTKGELAKIMDCNGISAEEKKNKGMLIN